MSSFIIRRLKVRGSQTGTPYATLCVVERCREVVASLTRPLASSPMNASDTSPGEGYESDGEAYNETVQHFLKQRLDRIRFGTEAAVVDVQEELKSGNEIDDDLEDLRRELELLTYEVDEAMEALEASGGDEE